MKFWSFLEWSRLRMVFVEGVLKFSEEVLGVLKWRSWFC